MSTASPRFCEECGSRIADGSRFCETCGRAVAVAPVPTPPPTAETRAPREPLAAGALAAAVAWVFGLGSVAGIVLGHLSLRRIRRSDGALAGEGLATAALAIGYGSLAVIPVAVVAVMVAS